MSTIPHRICQSAIISDTYLLMETYCMNTHTFMCSFTLTHTKKWGGGGVPQCHPLQKAFMLITVRALCLTYSVIMHNSTHRQQAGQYSRPWFKRHRLWLNIAVCEFETLN